MSLLCFSDILTRAGIDPARVKLIRHATSSKEFSACVDYDKNKGGNEMVMAYTRTQKSDFSDGFDYWAVFISSASTTCVFYGLFRVLGSKPDTPDLMPSEYPKALSRAFEGNYAYYTLEHDQRLSSYENRLIIDWGNSFRTWHQKGTAEKKIVALRNSKPFTGYEEVIFSFDELAECVSDPVVYSDWYDALSSIYAIYLIVDTVSGEQYVGSAYGINDGLWGRWASYAETKHGGNQGLMAHLEMHPDRHRHFQFSILHVLPKHVTNDYVVHLENRYKEKLLTRRFGLNKN